MAAGSVRVSSLCLELGYRFRGRIDTASPPGISAAFRTVFNAFSTVAAWTRLSLVGAACTTADRNPQGACITRPAYPPHASAAFSFLRHSSAVVPSRSKGTLLFGLVDDPANLYTSPFSVNMPQSWPPRMSYIEHY